MKMIAIAYMCFLLMGSTYAITRTYDLNVTYAMADVDGEWRQIIHVNGQMPGPLIWANEGDQLVISVTNHLYAIPISIHWHGQLQRGTPYMDGTAGITQCPILHMQTFVYNFTAADAGTYWYHSHVDAQYPEGLLGPLVVYPKVDPYAGQYDEEIVVVLQDWFRTRGDEMVTLMKEGHLEIIPVVPFFGPQTPPSYLIQSILIQGQGWHYTPLVPGQYFNESVTNKMTVFNVKHGKRYLVRLINAASISNLQFYIQGHSQKIVEVDSTFVEPIISQNGMKLEVGQRTSFIFTANQTVGNYYIQVPLPDVAGAPFFSQFMGVAALHYEGAAPAVVPNVTGAWLFPDLPLVPVPDVDLFHSLKPLVANPPPLKVTKSFTLVIDSVDQYYTINNKLFHHPTGNYVLDRFLNKTVPEDIPHIDLQYGDVVEITLINQGYSNPVNHPFHLHGHNFWVMGYGLGAPNTSEYNLINPTYRDTQVVLIDPMNHVPGWTTIRFIADNPGVWHFHCHMEWHLTMGLALIFNEALDRLAPPVADTPLCGLTYKEVYSLPQSVSPTCKADVIQSSVGERIQIGQYYYIIMIVTAYNLGARNVSSVFFDLSVDDNLIINPIYGISLVTKTKLKNDDIKYRMQLTKAKSLDSKHDTNGIYSMYVPRNKLSAPLLNNIVVTCV